MPSRPEAAVLSKSEAAVPSRSDEADLFWTEAIPVPPSPQALRSEVAVSFCQFCQNQLPAAPFRLEAGRCPFSGICVSAFEVTICI